MPYALASVQHQSETALEILLVLDGATAACREIAFSAAQTDPRIKVLDLPKDSGTGNVNVDSAVKQATAERIFYIDDDDLWLRDHVAQLGPFLDQAAVVDSRVCSLDRRGALHLGPCRASNTRARELLAGARLKLLYDTHFAHRKDAYEKLSSWIVPLGAPDRVWDFFIGFAKAPECRWASCDAVTALSIHGGARTDMNAQARALEISDWSMKIANLDGVLARSDSLFHLFRLLMADRPDTASLADYLSARGGYNGDFSRREQDVFALFTATPPPDDKAIDLAIALAEPVEAGYLFQSVALTYFNAYGQERHERILLQAAARSGPNLAPRIAAFSAALFRREPRRAVELAELALALGPDLAGSLLRWRDSAVKRLSD